MNQPKWPVSTKSCVDELTEEFEQNLRRIAIRLARHERAINVDPRHVQEAFGALARAGLTRIPWFRRTELEAAAGTALITVGLASPDCFGLLELNANMARIVMICGSVIGAVLVIHSWLRGLFRS